MARNDLKTKFFCSSCGNEFSVWNGKCLACGEWNTLKEINIEKLISTTGGEKILPKKLTSYKIEKSIRIDSGFSELNRVFGGGIVCGSVVLLGGEPGIGKSTLLLQMVSEIPSTLYISAEESPQQIKLRADRLGAKVENISVVETSDISNLEQAIIEYQPKLIIVDSIQTVFTSNISGTAGSQTQVKESGLILQQLAKKYNVAIIIVGHVTKDGAVAGPKMLEHLVDVVLYMEGERNHDARILRSVKNRFGNTDEIAILKMAEKGLAEVKNPGALFLSESENAPGSAITVLLEGARPLLVEIQALVTSTTFGYPRRTTSGFDLNRLNILIGILTKRADLNLGNQDVYINVVGGIKAEEPSADLAVCLAIASSFKNKPLPEKTVFFSEVGLTGENRKVSGSEKRKKEAEKLGFKVRFSYKNIKESIEKTLF